MTFWEWAFVHKMLVRYGYAPPLLDVGGVPNTAMADAEGFSGFTGIVRTKSWYIWEGIGQSDSTHNVEAFASDSRYAGKYMTILSTSTLEHAANPFTFMRAVKTLLGVGGLAIIVTVFAWGEHGDYDKDNWRFTRHGLELLVSFAGLDLLEVGMQELNPRRQHSYIICSNGQLGERQHNIVMPDVVWVR